MRRAFLIATLVALSCSATAQPVGPAAPAPGIFAMKKTGAALHLSVTGHSFTSKAALENYLAFRAAEATLDNRFQWFSFTEKRAKGDTVPVPRGDPAGPRFSFRMEFFRPQWRFARSAGGSSTGASANPPHGAKAWANWSPFSGQAFPDLKGADYEVSADIVMHKGMVDDVSPLAFDAGAVSDYLINQVEAPK